MFKKVFLILVLVFILLTLAIAFIGPRLINSDRIKDRVIELIREKYNYDIKIDSLRFSFFLGVKARGEGIRVQYATKAGYGLDLNAGAVEASVQLIPLFHRKIEIGKILIDTPVIILEESKIEVVKAEEGGKKPLPLLPEAPLRGKMPLGSQKKDAIEAISVAGLVIRNGRIEVKSKTLLPERFSAAELSEINLQAAPMVLNKSMKIDLKGKLKITPVSGKSLFLRPVEISVAQNIEISDKAIIIKDLKFGLESISLSFLGSLSNFREPLLEAKISIVDVDMGSFKNFLNFSSGQSLSGGLNFEGSLKGPLDKYLDDNLMGALEFKEASFDNIIPNAALKLDGKLDLTSSSVLKELLSGNLNRAKIKGRLSLPGGSFNKIAFRDLSSQISYENNVADLSQARCSLYGGGFNGTIHAAMGAEPDFSLSAAVRDISIEKFLADTSTMKDTVYGRVNSNLELKGKGKDLPAITQNMKGNMHIEMSDGKITTLNLLRSILSVAGLVTGIRPPPGDYTQVDILTADAVISDGKAATNNLRLVSKGMEVVGTGNFSFDQKLDFILDAYVGVPREGYEGGGGFLGKYMKDKFGRLVVPVRVTGTISNPHVSLDTRRLTANILDQEIKDLLPKIFK